MTVKIVTDGTCDLPQTVADKHGITVIPLYINVGDQSYIDGVELSREEFYKKLPDYPTPPTTSVPGVEVFQNTYYKLIANGADQILSIHVASSLFHLSEHDVEFPCGWILPYPLMKYIPLSTDITCKSLQDGTLEPHSFGRCFWMITGLGQDDSSSFNLPAFEFNFESSEPNIFRVWITKEGFFED